MASLFLQHGASSGWSALLVDASNAFNSLNRVALLWNVRVLWPRCSRFVFNTYCGWATLVVRGSQEYLYSMEGVTQGDPLSMFLYVIGTLLFDSFSKEYYSCSCAMLLIRLRVVSWFMILLNWMLFSSLGVSVVCNHRYLGGFIGEPASQTAFVQDKVHIYYSESL